MSYTDRESRNAFIAEKFKQYLTGSIINIGGGGEHHLKKYLPRNTQYVEVDIAGTPDVKLNIETDLPLPFQSRDFDTSVCTDVLEHVENLHALFDELVRVTDKTLIISVPNATPDALRFVLQKKYRPSSTALINQVGVYTKYYGLPLAHPEDRHKWFFSYDEAERFLRYQAEQKGLEIVQIFPTYNTKNTLRLRLMRIASLILGKQRQRNLFAHTLWAVLQKKYET